MAKVHFLLKERMSLSPTLILLVYRARDGRMVRSTKEFICPDDWDFSEQMPKAKRNRADLREVYSMLIDLKRNVTADITRIRASGGNISKRQARDIVDVHLHLAPTNARMLLNDFIDQYLIPPMNHDNKKLMIWFVWIMDKVMPDATVYDMNEDTFNQMHLYLRSNQYTKNSIRTALSAFKRVARKIEDAYPDYRLNIQRMEGVGYEKVRKLALSVDELLQMYRYQGYDEKLRRVVDLFILMSFTGIRVKDALLGSDANLDGDDFFIMDTSKTGSRVVLPRHWVVDDIIKRNGGYPRAQYSYSFMIRLLREAVRQSGIEGSFMYSITVGGSRKTMSKSKVEAITWHTARRSFATNLHKAGVPVKVAMIFTGHRTIQQYMDYINIDEQSNAEQYIDHPFFTKK